MEQLNSLSPIDADVESKPHVGSVSGPRRGIQEKIASSTPPRLIPRDLPYYQSRNKVQVDHNLGRQMIWTVIRFDFYHVLLRLPLYQSMAILLSVWTVFILLFAGIYVASDRHDPMVPCGLGPAGSPIPFYGAFAFSLETCTNSMPLEVDAAQCRRSATSYVVSSLPILGTTVGYGLPSSVNAFFMNCPQLQVAIFFQIVWSMMFNAFLFAFFYSRIARGEARGIQVVYSRKAIVSVVRGQVRLQVRVFDVDSRYPIVEAHVRLYGVRKDRPVPQQLRLVQPNDELNGMLFLSAPSVIVHHIDCYSLLHPPATSLPVQTSGLTLRQADSITGNREEVICPSCGEDFGTRERFVKHVRYQKIIEEHDKVEMEGSHRAITEDDLLVLHAASCTDLTVLQEYFHDEIAEVVAVVEGIDPITSLTFQALQSYRYEDIIWSNHASFHPCIAVDKQRMLRVDLDRFHDVDMTSSVSETDATPSNRRHLSRMRHNSLRPADFFLELGGNSSTATARNPFVRFTTRQGIND